MYRGSQFERFWAECRGTRIHPQDAPFFQASGQLATPNRLPARFETSQYGPWPFDGPLDSARVIICLANARYSPADAQHATLIEQQRTGREPLPWPWARFYEQNIARPIGLPLDELRTQVAVLNVCPYPSTWMEEPELRLAAGLPSVWQAQKYVREVLLPRAEAGRLFLVFRRKHRLWGVHEGFAARTISIVRQPTISARLPADIGARIREWLGAGAKA